LDCPRDWEMDELSKPARSVVKIHLVGPTQAAAPSGYAQLPRSKRARAILAVVGLSRDHRCLRSHLASLLWDDASEDSARANLRQALHDLARSFDDFAPGFVQANRESVALDPQRCWIDVNAFGSGHCDPKLELAEIADFNPQRLLEDLNGLSPSLEDWLLAERTAFGARLAAEMNRQLGAALRPDVGVRQRQVALGHILKCDPTHEQASRAMMRTFVEMGETAQALYEFERCRTALRTALDIEPSSETRALYQTIRATASKASAEPALSTEKPPLPDKPSIAVLPFQNMSGDPEQDYFVDGMVEDIIAALSRFRSLFVIARNSSFTYKGQAVDVKQAGRDLGVRYVLEGSVRKAGNRIRITGQLIDAVTGAHLWAERYDRDLSNIFALQDEISGSVAGIIEPALAAAEQQRVLRKPPERLDAWEAYQRGLWHFHRYRADDNKTAMAFFRQAIALDLNFAPGHYGYALALQWDIWHFSNRPFLEVQGTAREEAHIAVSLDNNDAIARAVLAHMMMWGSEWEAAIAEARTAIALNPNSAFVISMLGCVLGFGGYREEALDRLHQAMRASPHDPLTWLWATWIGTIQLYSRKFDAAVETLHQVVRLRPGYTTAQVLIAASLAHLGRLDEARDHLSRAQVRGLDSRYQYQPAPWLRPEDYALRVEGLRLAAGETK
jgi:adenylate cyclase